MRGHTPVPLAPAALPAAAGRPRQQALGASELHAVPPRTCPATGLKDGFDGLLTEKKNLSPCKERQFRVCFLSYHIKFDLICHLAKLMKLFPKHWGGTAKSRHLENRNN